MKAIVISIGDELTLGQTVDTNAAWLAQQLARVGITCESHLTVGDDRRSIGDAIRSASRGAGLVLVTGGIGPTPDDLTRAALADVLGVELRIHQRSLDRIVDYFRERKRPMAPANRDQAMIPVGAEAIDNTCGTACGIGARVGEADIFVMPGVPDEMRTMFRRSVLPGLESVAAGACILQRTLHTFGMSESEIGERIGDLMVRDRNPSVGTSASEAVISIRVNACGESAGKAASLAAGDLAEIRRRLGRSVFGEDDETLADAVARHLVDGRKTVAVAESCTGGLVAKRLTDVAGSSAYFVQGMVTYSNEAKRRALGVSMELIDRHGAVSREVAEAMATGCRRLAETDYGLSATGIAGPAGGTAAKPVGLVHIALASGAGVTARELHLGEHLERRQVRDRAAKCVLNLLRLELLREPQ